MSVDPSQILCVECGLCCNGTLVDDIHLKSWDEADAMEDLGLELDEDTDGVPSMLTPCRALKGTRCSVYEHRPSTCRSFECRVLQEVRIKAIDEQEAMSLIRKAQSNRKAPWIRKRFF